MKLNFDSIVNQILFISLRSSVTIVGFIGAAVLVIQGETALLDDTWSALSDATNLISGFAG